MIKISPSQLPSMGKNSIIDYQKSYAIKIVHNFPDCNNCLYAQIYKGDGTNIYKHQLIYRIYCTSNRAPIQVPKTLEKPIPFNDLWLPYKDWIPSLNFPVNYKYHIYIASCILTKEMKRCVVLQSSLPESKWKGMRKLLINTKDNSIFDEEQPNQILPSLY